MYDYSPVISRFDELIVVPDVNRFYWSFGAVFFILFFLLAVGINFMIQVLITRPILILTSRLRKNDLGPQKKTITNSPSQKLT
jgi:hypothetical protein